MSRRGAVSGVSMLYSWEEGGRVFDGDGDSDGDDDDGDGVYGMICMYVCMYVSNSR